MMPVIPCSTNNVTLFPGSTLVSRKNYQLTRSSLLQKSSRQTLSSQCLPLPLSTSIRLLLKYRSGCLVRHGLRVHILAATGTDIAVEEPSSAISGEDADGNSEAPTSAVETGEASSSIEEAATTPSAQSKRPRPVRKSDMPSIQNEELVPGAAFTGKVRSIQPFGAFVDFGAFTDGLVHVSQLSDTFVKDVGDVVTLGQEVKVRLVEANMETKRISLTMREDDDISKSQQRKDSPGSSNDKSRPGRRTPKSNQKSSKFVKGQDLEGTVKNTNRAGAFISLPEGEEGFLPTSEEYTEGFASMIEGSSLNVGEEVSVRVLRITRGQVTLTMKKEEDIAESNSKVIQGVVHVATNPFARAFRENKDIAAFLDTEKVQKAAQTSVVSKSPEEIEGKNSKTEILSEISEEQSSNLGQLNVPSAVHDVVKDDITSPVVSEKEAEASDTSLNDTVIDETTSPEETEKEVEASVTSMSPAPTEPVITDENPEDLVSDSSEVVDAAQETIQKEEVSESLSPEESVATTTAMTEEPTVTDEVKDDVIEPNPATEIGGDQILSSESVVSEEVQASRADDTVRKDEVQDDTPSTTEKEIPSPTQNGDVKVESVTEENGNITTSSGQGGSLSSKDNPTKGT